MRKWLILCFFILLGGCHSPQQSGFIEALEEQQVPVEVMADKEKSIFTQDLNGEKPKTYLLNDKLLSVYTFDRSSERSQAKQLFYEKTAAQNVVSYELYEQNTILIFYGHEQNLSVTAPYDEQIRKALTQIREDEE